MYNHAEPFSGSGVAYFVGMAKRHCVGAASRCVGPKPQVIMTSYMLCYTALIYAASKCGNYDALPLIAVRGVSPKAPTIDDPDHDGNRILQRQLLIPYCADNDNTNAITTTTLITVPTTTPVRTALTATMPVTATPVTNYDNTSYTEVTTMVPTTLTSGRNASTNNVASHNNERS